MATETKGFLSSNVIQGLLLIAVPFLDQTYQYLQGLPQGILPKGVALAVTGLGWVLSMKGRMKKEIQPIKGVV